MNNQSFLIGIAGGTGSGKTSNTKAIAADFSPSEVAVIQQDSYYRDLSNVSLEERSRMNFDHPNAMDFELMKDQLTNLLDGHTVHIPSVYLQCLAMTEASPKFRPRAPVLKQD